MNIKGHQLHIVTVDEVLQRAERWGVRILVEAAPLEGRNKWVARVCVSHALLPGHRGVLGLLVQEVPGEPSDLIYGDDATEVIGKAASALAALKKEIRFSKTPDSPARLEAAEASMHTRVEKLLH